MRLSGLFFFFLFFFFEVEYDRSSLNPSYFSEKTSYFPLH